MSEGGAPGPVAPAAGAGGAGSIPAAEGGPVAPETTPVAVGAETPQNTGTDTGPAPAGGISEVVGVLGPEGTFDGLADGSIPPQPVSNEDLDRIGDVASGLNGTTENPVGDSLVTGQKGLEEPKPDSPAAQEQTAEMLAIRQQNQELTDLVRAQAEMLKTQGEMLKQIQEAARLQAETSKEMQKAMAAQAETLKGMQEQFVVFGQAIQGLVEIQARMIKMQSENDPEARKITTADMLKIIALIMALSFAKPLLPEAVQREVG